MGINSYDVMKNNLATISGVHNDRKRQQMIYELTRDGLGGVLLDETKEARVYRQTAMREYDSEFVANITKGGEKDFEQQLGKFCADRSYEGNQVAMPEIMPAGDNRVLFRMPEKFAPSVVTTLEGLPEHGRIQPASVVAPEDNVNITNTQGATQIKVTPRGVTFGQILSETDRYMELWYQYCSQNNLSAHEAQDPERFATFVRDLALDPALDGNVRRVIAREIAANVYQKKELQNERAKLGSLIGGGTAPFGMKVAAYHKDDL